MTADQGLRAPNPLFSARFAGVAWQAIVARGVAGILFGLLAMFMPVAAALTIVMVFSIYLMADGFLAIASAFRAMRQRHAWGLLAIEGVANIVASLILIFSPGLGMVTFVLIVAIWALVAGVVKLLAAFKREPVAARGWLALSAVISLGFGILLLLAPMLGAVVLTWWLGVYGVVFGAVLLFLGFQVRSLRGKTLG